jgi:hypothetical protein
LEETFMVAQWAQTLGAASSFAQMAPRGAKGAAKLATARPLLLLHWTVESESTVRFIKTTINTMSADKSMGRAEALRQSMIALIDKGAPHETHPAYWAPFVVAGEGGAVGTSAQRVVAPSSSAKGLRRAKRAKTGHQNSDNNATSGLAHPLLRRGTTSVLAIATLTLSPK